MATATATKKSKIDVFLLPEFVERVTEEAEKAGTSPGRFIGAVLAEHLDVAPEKAVPPLGRPGRPRAKRRRR